MITCPSCQNEELFGALFCSRCGSQLNYQPATPRKTASYTAEAEKPHEAPQHAPVDPQPMQVSTPAPMGISLRILDTGQSIPLDDGNEYALGRVSGSQPILPDIDLSPYQAYENGISRLHATIKIKDDQATITDLGSANGTMVNNAKLAPHEPHTLEPGDLITLGRLKTQLVVNS